MIVIGIDPHKCSHTATAMYAASHQLADKLGRAVVQLHPAVERERALLNERDRLWTEGPLIRELGSRLIAAGLVPARFVEELADAVGVRPDVVRAELEAVHDRGSAVVSEVGAPLADALVAGLLAVGREAVAKRMAVRNGHDRRLRA